MKVNARQNRDSLLEFVPMTARVFFLLVILILLRTFASPFSSPYSVFSGAGQSNAEGRIRKPGQRASLGLCFAVERGAPN